MKSKNVLYELILTPQEHMQLPKMPTGQELQGILCAKGCSDLFVNGFSYKPVDLCVGAVGQGDNEYKLLKCLKNAKYIHDSVRASGVSELLEGLENEETMLEGGYIGYSRDVTSSVRNVRVGDVDFMFGVELRKGSLFRCFAIAENDAFPRKITVNGKEMEILRVNVVEDSCLDRRVLQADMPLDPEYRVDKDSKSAFKLAYDPVAECTVVCAGSVICDTDFFGNGVLL